VPHPTAGNGEAAAILTAADDRLAVLHTTILGNTPTRASVIGTEASLEIGGPFYQPGGFDVRSSDGTRSLEYREAAIGHAASWGSGTRLRPGSADASAVASILQNIDRRVDVTSGGADRGHDALVTGSLEVVKPCPVIRQVARLEDVHGDRRAMRIKNQRRITKASAPTSIHEFPVDVTLEPAAIEPVELMMVRATRRETSVRRQPLRLHVSRQKSNKSPMKDLRFFLCE
jgi:hypothetical protein